MENEIFKKLKMLIEALTHSGCNILDGNIFKEIKGICKSSRQNVMHVYCLVLEELKKNNSQIRLAAFQICKELFKKSSLFRENVLRDLHIIFDLTTDINSSKKLPPPKSCAKNLKCLSISTLKSWVEEFGETYKKLKIAYKYFEKCKQVNFETLQIGNSAEQMIENEQQRHLRLVNEEKMKKVLEEFNSNASEIETTVTSLSNCLSLLLPPAEEFFIPEHNLHKISIMNDISSSDSNYGSSSGKDNNSIIGDENEDNEDNLWNNKSNLRECGISFDYKLSLELDLEDKFKVVKTEENSSVVENAKDCVRLIKNRFLPMVKRWIKVHCMCAERNSNNIKKIIDLKEKLENILKKYNSLIIDEEHCTYDNESDSDDDHDFEEVKKEGYEDSPVDFPEEMMLDCLKGKSDAGGLMKTVASTSKDSIESAVNISTPSTSNNESDSDSSLKSISSTNRDEKKISQKLSCDLCNSDDGNSSTPALLFTNSTKTIVDKTQFWECGGSNDIHEPQDPNALRTGVRIYSGTIETMELANHATLAKGKLNQRKERFKVSTELDLMIPIPIKRGKKRKSENKNLTHKKMKTSRGALKILESKNLPGLIDVVKRQNNAYTRLSKKIFNRSSLRKMRNCE